MLSRLISVAPMMDCTDKHFRYLLRLITRHTLLYTEMITSGAILHGSRDRLLAYDNSEHPLALQLGGSDPVALATCARIAEDYGYDEINLNVGCPSDRVQNGRFGACLMKEPHLVAECIFAMRNATQIPITVKTRIGVDELDSYEYFSSFIAKIAAAGCQTFIIHARKAWLKGLSPKENRTIPPLHYETVYRLKRDFPALEIIINGGIKTLTEMQQHLAHVDGVMLGREAYQNPYLFAGIDQAFYGDKEPSLSRFAVIEQFIPYAAMQLKQGVRLTTLTRHLLGLFYDVPGAQRWRRYISEHVSKQPADVSIIKQAAAQVPELS